MEVEKEIAQLQETVSKLQNIGIPFSKADLSDAISAASDMTISEIKGMEKRQTAALNKHIEDDKKEFATQRSEIERANETLSGTGDGVNLGFKGEFAIIKSDISDLKESVKSLPFIQESLKTLITSKGTWKLKPTAANITLIGSLMGVITTAVVFGSNFYTRSTWNEKKIYENERKIQTLDFKLDSLLTARRSYR